MSDADRLLLERALRLLLELQPVVQWEITPAAGAALNVSLLIEDISKRLGE